MGLFSPKCEVCGKGDAWKECPYTGFRVCDDCNSKIFWPNAPKTVRPEHMPAHIKYRDENHARMSKFKPTEMLEIGTHTFAFNDETRQFYHMNSGQRSDLEKNGGFLHKPEPFLYSYDDVLAYQYFENDSAIASKQGIGKAVAGGILFGVADAIVGNAMRQEPSQSMITNMRVTVSLDNEYEKAAELVFKDGSGITYGSAEYVRLKSLADAMIRFFDHVTGNEEEQEEQPEEQQPAGFSPSEEIMKPKDLLDQGIITEDEFSQMKQKLIARM